MAKKIDVEFLQRTAMVLATALADRQALAEEQVSASMRAILAELGVRTPYPPVIDAA